MKPSRGLLIIVGYAAAAVLLGFALIQLDLPDQCLVILLVPPVVASVNNPRILYLSMAVVFLAVSVWVASELALVFHRSVETVQLPDTGSILPRPEQPLQPVDRCRQRPDPE